MPLSMNVFASDIFSATSLTTAIEKVPFRPTGIGDLGIFEDMPIRTRTFIVEARQGKLVILPFIERGGPRAQRTNELRNGRSFQTYRLGHQDVIWASELQSIRAFGSETELMQLQDEVMRRMAGPTGLMRNLEYTWEYHRLAAVQGKLLDADGTVVYDWFAEFGITPPTEIAFNLAAWQGGAQSTAALSAATTAIIPAGQLVTIGGTGFEVANAAPLGATTLALTYMPTTPPTSGASVSGTGIAGGTTLVSILPVASTPDGSLRRQCNDVVRRMARASQGAFTQSTQVYALAGDLFWDMIVTHPDVTRTYYNWQAAAELRKGSAFEAFPFGNIMWMNYRGSDDNSTVAIAPDKAKFFPVGAPGVFQRALSPHEDLDLANTLGKPVYAKVVPDRDRNEWVSLEVDSYPLHICTRPEVLLTGRAGA